MAEITYQLHREDLLVLSDEFTKRSTTARTHVQRIVLRSAAYFVFACMCVWWLTGNVAITLGVLIFGIILVALIPMRIKRAQRRLTAEIYREGSNRALFLPMTLSVDRDCLAWKSESGAGYVKFEYIERVRQNDTHLLIYLNVRNAYIVPRHGIISGDFESFAWEVEKRWRSAMDTLAHLQEMSPA
jgi:hypothetical protein